MMNITDQLIKDYLVESYTSKAAGSDADRLAAEKAFKAELTNGPAKSIYYANGIQGQKKVGSFDLDNFHKAYDKWFEDNNLLDIFIDDGKLVNRGTYARFKDLAKKEPAVKALGQLWGAQFKYDYEFLSDKLAKQNAEAKLEQDKQDCLDRFNAPAVLDKITSTTEWQDLIDAYPADMRDDIKPEVKVDFHYNDILISKVVLKVNGVIAPPVADVNFGCIRVEDPEELSEADIIKQITDPKAVADMLVGIKRIVPAAMLMINNYEEFTKRPESQIDVLTRGTEEDMLAYYDREHNKYYKAIFKNFPINGSTKPGLMLIDVDDEHNKAGRLTMTCVLVAATVDYSTTSYNCYFAKSYRDYYKASYMTKAVADKLQIETRDKQSRGNCDSYVKISDAGNFKHPELSKFFNRESYFSYECDSSD